MPQGPYNVPTGGTVAMVSFAADLNAAYDALASQSSGAGAPANGPGGAPLEFQTWFDTTNVNFPVFRFFDGVNWDRVGTLDVANSNWLPQFGGGIATLASASTVNLAATPQTFVTISGTATINQFGSSADVAEGETTMIVASGAFTIVNSGSIVCPNGQNIKAAVGDAFFATYLGSGNWQIVGYVRQSTKDLFLNIEDFGGKGDNSIDNTTPLANAFAALPGQGGQVYFPAGKYKFNSNVTFNLPSGVFSVSIIGAGQDATTLTWPAGGGLGLNYNGISSSAHIRDLSLTTGAVNTGAAITLNMAASIVNPALTATSSIKDVTIRGEDGYAVTDCWAIGVDILNVSNVNVDDISVFGASTANGIGVNLLGLPGSSTFGVQYNISESTFQNLTDGVVYGSFVQGVTVDQSNFTATTNGIVCPVLQLGTLAQLTVSNCQFNPVGGTAIFTGTSIVNTQICDNLFIISANNGIGINLAKTQHFTITGNEITSVGSLTGTVGIIVGAAAVAGEAPISGNDIFGFVTGIHLLNNCPETNISGNTIQTSGNCVVLDLGANVISVQNNSLISAGATILNNSVSNTNRITGNIGWNPVGVSSVAVGASPFIYSAGPQPETLYIFGGTVSSLAVDSNSGGAFPLGTGFNSGTIHLGPNEAVKITHTGAPSVTRMIH